MKKLIALLLIALVIVVSGCTAMNGTIQKGGTNASNPLEGAFSGAGSEDVGSPPAMPQLPG